MIKDLNFRDWTFEVDKALTEETYRSVSQSGTESCGCTNCKNYVAYRDTVFPKEVIDLFNNLGIDYKKEVEVTYYETFPNGLHHVGGWFHFKGRLLKGKSYRSQLPSNGYTFDLTKIADNFSIGFAEGNDLTFFAEKKGLVQVEFDTNIPWIIDKCLEAT